MERSYNPLNCGRGGYRATYACGCTAGWISEINIESMVDVQKWLEDGARIEPLQAGFKVVRVRCAAHELAQPGR